MNGVIKEAQKRYRKPKVKSSRANIRKEEKIT
jgi:hypothetical protein